MWIQIKNTFCKLYKNKIDVVVVEGSHFGLTVIILMQLLKWCKAIQCSQHYFVYSTCVWQSDNQAIFALFTLLFSVNHDQENCFQFGRMFILASRVTDIYIRTEAVLMPARGLCHAFTMLLEEIYWFKSCYVCKSKSNNTERWGPILYSSDWLTVMFISEEPTVSEHNARPASIWIKKIRDVFGVSGVLNNKAEHSQSIRIIEMFNNL